MKCRPWLLVFLGLAPLCASAQLGSVQRALVLKPGSGGFVGPLGVDQFGEALAALGDVDGDGVQDLAVGAPLDDDGGVERGAVWILFLNPDGSVRAEQKISQTQGGFTGLLADEGRFGRKLARTGDLDGDGVPDLAVLSQAPNRLWVLLLDASGTVKGHAETLYTDPVFAPAAQAADFQNGDLAALGDVTGDGLGDLALGAPHDPDGAFGAGAVWIAALGANGAVSATRKISQLTGGFTGPLPAESRFGAALEDLGDLDGDGTRELAVVSPGSAFKGQVWVLSLDATSTVVTQHLRGPEDYGLAWPSGQGGTLGAVGRVLEPLGDLDGDGVGDLAIGFPYWTFPGSTEGGFVLGFLGSDGSVRRRLRIGEDRGGLGDLPRNSGLGAALAPLGDLDGDGRPELAVGAPGLRASGVMGGGVYLLSLAPSAVRNGSGLNPLTLTAPEPIFGTTWSATLDCSGHAPNFAFLFGYRSPLAPSPTFAGELLVGGTQRFFLQGVHAGGPVALSIGVPPPSIGLLDVPIHVQGACAGAPGLRLSNALDLLVGR
ncbi:MAG TPA: FG-GAP-like repeat-containing protein [Planctomycetota bacterium]